MDTAEIGWAGTIVVEYSAGLVWHRDVRCIGDWYWEKGACRRRDLDLRVQPGDTVASGAVTMIIRGALKDRGG